MKANTAIFVGEVSASKLIKTKMAKSVLDAVWAMLKTQLEYKAIARSSVFQVVNESYSTQACSCCGALSPNMSLTISAGGLLVIVPEDAGFVAVECQWLTVTLQISPGGFKIGERRLRTDEEKLHQPTRCIINVN